MQGAIYCGVPAANTAFKLTMDILRSEGLLDALAPPAPLGAGVRVATHHTFSQPQLRAAVQGLPNADKPPLVLSHALGLDLQMWDALAEELAAAGHEVLRYDHRGHGGSAVPPGPYAMDDLVEDAARLLREWGRGPVVFVGLSMGGMVGQGLALRHPGLLRGLVVANSTSRYPQAAQAVWAQRIAAVEGGGMAAVADAVVERYLHAELRAARPDLVTTLRNRLLRSDPAGYVAACHAVAGVDWLDALGAVRCPTLVIAGGRDAGATPAMGEAMAAAIPGARFELLAEASHLSVAECPAAFSRLLLDFLGRL
jgi:3-oxoadipate enol-lactonase